MSASRNIKEQIIAILSPYLSPEKAAEWGDAFERTATQALAVGSNAPLLLRNLGGEVYTLIKSLTRIEITKHLDQFEKALTDAYKEYASQNLQEMVGKVKAKILEKLQLESPFFEIEQEIGDIAFQEFKHTKAQYTARETFQNFYRPIEEKYDQLNDALLDPLLEVLSPIMDEFEAQGQAIENEQQALFLTLEKAIEPFIEPIKDFLNTKFKTIVITLAEEGLSEDEIMHYHAERYQSIQKQVEKLLHEKMDVCIEEWSRGKHPDVIKIIEVGLIKSQVMLGVQMINAVSDIKSAFKKYKDYVSPITPIDNKVYDDLRSFLMEVKNKNLEVLLGEHLIPIQVLRSTMHDLVKSFRSLITGLPKDIQEKFLDQATASIDLQALDLTQWTVSKMSLSALRQCSNPDHIKELYEYRDLYHAHGEKLAEQQKQAEESIKIKQMAELKEKPNLINESQVQTIMKMLQAEKPASFIDVILSKCNLATMNNVIEQAYEQKIKPLQTVMSALQRRIAELDGKSEIAIKPTFASSLFEKDESKDIKQSANNITVSPSRKPS